ncbi:MAG: hypothetical protein ACFFBD_17100 [Candidatus Hodarchaeota archaeon]
MKLRVLVFIGLIVGILVAVNPTSIIACQSIIDKQTKYQTADFYLNVTAPEVVPAGEVFNITAKAQLKASAQSASQITLTIVLEQGLDLVDGELSNHTLGDFSPGQQKQTTYTVQATEEEIFNPSVLVKIYLYKAGNQQWVETSDGIDPYNAFLVGIIYLELLVDGPLELKTLVVPRLKMLQNEEVKLTFNISNPGIEPVQNLSFRLEFGENEIQSVEYNLPVTSLAMLEPQNFSLVTIEIRCIVGYASISRIYFYVDAYGIDTIGRVVKIESYDLFNIYKYDNPIAIFMWPFFGITMSGLFVYVVFIIRRNFLRRQRIQMELEEKYGKPLYDSDF